LDQVFSFALTASAVLIAGSVGYRTIAISGRQVSSLTPAASTPAYSPDWRKVLPYGIRVGDASAPVQIIEFADLECPSCRAFHRMLQAVLADRPRDVAVVYVSFPISFHKFALGAARGAECAAAIGRFAEWIDAVYEKQDSLGLKSWGSYAFDAGIQDTASLGRCATDPRPVMRIDSGRVVGKSLGVTGTPTVFINGWRITGASSKEELTKLIESIQKGESPFRT
jgi:protein-disulfide isomerase